jgi:hypothetical protein
MEVSELGRGPSAESSDETRPHGGYNFLRDLKSESSRQAMAKVPGLQKF